MKRMLAVLAVLGGVVLWALPSAAEDTYIGSRVTTQQVVGGRLPDGGAAPVLLDAQGRVMTTASFAHVRLHRDPRHVMRHHAGGGASLAHGRLDQCGGAQLG